MRDNSIETLRRQSLVGILICSGGRACHTGAWRRRVGRMCLAPRARPQRKPGASPQDFGAIRQIALKARLKELRMNRAFRNCRAAILAANENNTAAKIAALQFLVSPKSLGRYPVFSVACGDRLLSSSIEERTKVRSRKIEPQRHVPVKRRPKRFSLLEKFSTVYR